MIALNMAEPHEKAEGGWPVLLRKLLCGESRLLIGACCISNNQLTEFYIPLCLGFGVNSDLILLSARFPFLQDITEQLQLSKIACLYRTLERVGFIDSQEEPNLRKQRGILRSARQKNFKELTAGGRRTRMLTTVFSEVGAEWQHVPK